MIKRLLAFSFLLFAIIGLKAQPFTNSWIDYSQKYYKVKVEENGIYRIDSATLAAVPGISLGNFGIDPRTIQIYNKGIQQYIYIQGESDGHFNSNDFIEFYGQKNDGELDAPFYFNSTFVPNPYYSLINDTAVYFVTFNVTGSTNRRMQVQSDTTFSAYTPIQYFFRDEVQENHNGYFQGATDYVGGTDARYTSSEGWFDDANSIYQGTDFTYNFNTPQIYSSGPSSIFKTVVVGASVAPVTLDHHVQIDLLGALTQTIKDTAFSGYLSCKFVDSIPSNYFATGNNSFKYSSLQVAGVPSNSRTAVSYLGLKYPHTMDLEGNVNYLMYLPDNAVQTKSLLNLTNFNAFGTGHIYDLTNALRIDLIQGAINFQALIPNSGGEKKCFISSEGQVKMVTSIVPVTTPTAQFTDFANQLVDSAYIIISNKAIWSGAQSYGTYRSSVTGGSHNVIMADIDELYDQFAYGIVKSPWSIKSFANFYIQKCLLNNHPIPHNLFLIGKSMHMRNCRNPAWFDDGDYSQNYALDLVPSYGNPSSDILLTAGLNGTVNEPAIPTGRLSARSSGEVLDYLNKVMQFDTVSPGEWKKQVLHFGGGISYFEQYAFRTFLNIYRDTIQNPYYGGHVYNFFKTTSSPIQINTSDTLRDFFDNGVSLMTFFGHASGQGFDQSTDDLSTYNPMSGHYPFLLANSCYAGDLHNSGFSFSETYVMLANKGMIGFLGSVGLGVPTSLNIYSREFYNQLSRKSYGKTMGSIIKKTIATVAPALTSNAFDIATCFDMTLHGDPAIKITPGSKPDYKITASNVTFDATKPGSILVNVARTNLGEATNAISLTNLLRVFSNGDTISYHIIGREPRFKDTLTFHLSIDNGNFKGAGLNKFYVTLDRNNQVAELNENNNSTGEVDFLINAGDIIPVYPYEFSIIQTDTITLKACTSDLLAVAKNYIFQIDTIDTFNSPSMRSATLTAPGGVVKWNPQLGIFPFAHFTDSTVYYWRVSPDSTSPLTPRKWRESSFQYIANTHGSTAGWEQARFFQFKNDKLQYAHFDRTQRKFVFFDDLKVVSCITGIPDAYNYAARYTLNSSELYYEPWIAGGSGFTFAIFDPITGNVIQSVNDTSNPLNGYSASWGNISSYPANHVENAFDFFDDTVGQTRMHHFITSKIQDGQWVLAFASRNNIPNYSSQLKSDFQNLLGAPNINNVPANRDYVMFGTKGGSATEYISDSTNEEVHFTANFMTHWNQGSISSPIIGPARSWHSLHWRWKSLDANATADSIVVRVIGIKANGSEVTLANYNTSNTDVLNLGSVVDSSLYPNIRLVAYISDNTNHTAPQLKRWHVVYDPVPEAAINPPLVASSLLISTNDIQEGDNFKLRIPVQNISNLPFTQDSLLMSYWITDAAGATHQLPSKLKKKPFNPNEVIIDSISINSLGYKGNNALWVEVNPVNKPHSQLEQYHFNNIIRIPFHVSGDRINPLLDVTFDGVHILNNDIVSAKPNVLIKLKDENRFLALNDTTNFKVFLQSPGSPTAKRVWFGSTMSFVPAVLPNNSCKLNYTPELTQDGTYQLLVQASDISRNLSGAIDYKISFEVINKATITEVMNYPNPFNNATHFVFTLTGSQVPSTFKIQIMTITGKVVKEIFQDEIGFIHVGRNITEYAWDGRDEFGDRLANGVYLYRVITKLNGDDIEHRDSDADQYFKKGWGKMFLMR